MKAVAVLIILFALLFLFIALNSDGLTQFGAWFNFFGFMFGAFNIALDEESA